MSLASQLWLAPTESGLATGGACDRPLSDTDTDTPGESDASAHMAVSADDGEPSGLAHCPEYPQPPVCGRGTYRVGGSDITALRTQEGWLYIAIVVDLFSRKVVGWACAASMATGLVTQALPMAIGQRQPKPGLLHHSDRGSQYASGEYQQQLQDAKMVCSMSRKGNCYDNAVVERVFRSLKEEGFTDDPPDTRAEATLSVIDYLVMFYNSQRLHSTLGYQSPITFEAQAAKTEQGETQVWPKQ